MIDPMAAPPHPRSHSQNSGHSSSPTTSNSHAEDDMFSPTSAAALALSTLHHFGAERDNSRTTNNSLRATRLFNGNNTSAANGPYYHHPTTVHAPQYHSYNPDIRYERPWAESHSSAAVGPWHPPPTAFPHRYHAPPPPPQCSQDSTYSQEGLPPHNNHGNLDTTTARLSSNSFGYHHLDASCHHPSHIPKENSYHVHPRMSLQNLQGPSPLVSRSNTFDGSYAANQHSEGSDNRRSAPTSFVTPTPKKAKLEHTTSEKAVAAAMIKTPTGYSRKKKSLGILAENFLRTYENLTVGQTIVVDEAAVRLGVERRRIYDVVNILESICLVCKKQKNTYTWIGTEKLDAVFGRLQAQAILEYPEDAEKRLGSSENRCDLPPVPLKPPRRQSKTRENKSLAKLSQEFLQVFLVGHEVLSLPEASDKIQGTTSQEELIAMGLSNAEDSKQDPKELKAAAARGLKTKIRRLYDIANVFLSVGLLKKVDSNDSSRRPNFAWSYKLSAKEIFDLHQKSAKEE